MTANILILLAGLALVVSALVVPISVFVGKKNSIDRLDGALFLLLEAAYMTYLIIHL